MPTNTPEEHQENPIEEHHELGSDRMHQTASNIERAEVAHFPFDSLGKGSYLVYKYNQQKWENFPNWDHYWYQRPGGDVSETDFEGLLKPLLERDTKQCEAWKEEVQNLLILVCPLTCLVIHT